MTLQRTIIRTATLVAAIPLAAGMALAQDTMPAEQGAVTPPAEEPLPAEQGAVTPPAEAAMPAEPTHPPATIDSNGDGIMDAWDRNADGKADAWDTTGDGAPDAVDDDGDGHPDETSPE